MKRWDDRFGVRVGSRRDHEEVGRPFWCQGRQQEGTMKRWADRFGSQARQEEGAMKRWDDRFGARVGSRRGP